jgi:hypothetical protein
MVNWLHGPNDTRVPAIGVPSASSAPGRERDGASYNLYQIDGVRGAWRCTMISRGLDSARRVVQQDKISLIS